MTLLFLHLDQALRKNLQASAAFEQRLIGGAQLSSALFDTILQFDVQSLQLFLGSLTLSNVNHYRYGGLRSAHFVQNRSGAHVDPQDRSITANKPLFQFKRCAPLHQAIEKPAILFDIITVGEGPNRLTEQLRFREAKHFTKSLVDKNRSAGCVRANDASRCLCK